MKEPIQIQIITDGEDRPTSKQVFEDLGRNFSWMLKLNKLVVQIKKNMYDEYLAAGFSKEQAMFLVK